jgi:cell shape-determining protein MreC
MRRTLLPFALGLAGLGALIGLSGLLRWPWQALDRPGAALREALVPDAVDDPALDLAEETARLRERCADLGRRLSAYEELAGGAATDVQEVLLTPALVRSRGDRHAAHLVEIDRGAADGVGRGLAVTVGWSLVGVVRGEQSGRSLVQLVTDPVSRIPAHLVTADGVTIALGSLAGTGSWTALELRLVQDRPGLEIAAGQLVVTADGHEAVPPGLLLGRVVSAQRSSSDDHWRIAVEPLRSPALLTRVQVLKDLRPRVAP